MALSEDPGQLNLVEPADAGRPEFVKIEKNLSSMGFFTPSKSRGKVELREKVIRFRREVEGRILETTATILPSAKYGLPTTADQDKFFAFQKILNDIKQRQGRVENPIGFSSKELLDILRIQDAGRNYQEITEWLQRMTVTAIHSKGVIYLAGRELWASDTFHVFERVVAYGMNVGDGRLADKNYVWLSEWQLENINNNYLMPLDLDTYWKLRGNIAKALVPLLQIWLYASRNAQKFQKRYEELCSLLDIKHQRHVSEMKKQLGPSLTELVEYGYLKQWWLEPTLDGRSFKLVAEHGEKFFLDRKVQLLRSQGGELDRPEPERSLIVELTARGVGERQARRLLQDLPLEQPVRLQLAWIDHLITLARNKIQNPPGFCISMLRDNVRVPDWFESQQQGENTARQMEQDNLAWVERMENEERYRQYRREEVQRHIDTVLGKEEFERMVAERGKVERRKYKNLTESTITEIATGYVERELEAQLGLMNFAKFCENSQTKLF